MPFEAARPHEKRDQCMFIVRRPEKKYDPLCLLCLELKKYVYIHV